jgi:hypothetical protein
LTSTHIRIQKNVTGITTATHSLACDKRFNCEDLFLEPLCHISNTLNFENRELNFNLEPTFLGFKDIPTRDRDKEVRTILHLYNVAKAAPDRFQATEKLIQEETKRDLTSTVTTKDQDQGEGNVR